MITTKDNKLEIYFGQVGKSYVDYETAVKEYEHAKENYGDWTRLSGEAEKLKKDAQDVLDEAVEITAKIDELIKELNNDDYSPKAKEEAKKLLAELLHLDNIKDVNTEEINKKVDEYKANIQKIIDRIDCGDSDNDADGKKCLMDFANLQIEIWQQAAADDSEYAKAVEKAEALFTSYLEDYAPESATDASDRLEDSFQAELDSLKNQLESLLMFGPNTDEVLEEIQAILDASVQPPVKGKYLFKMITEAEGTDRFTLTEYINNEGIDIDPETFTSEEGVEVTIPASNSKYPVGSIFALLWDKSYKLYKFEEGGTPSPVEEDTYYQYSPKEYYMYTYFKNEENARTIKLFFKQA